MRHFLFISTLWLLSFPLYAAEQQEGARSLSESPLSAINLLQTIMGLILVLGCVVLLAWLLRRTGRFHTAANGKMKVIAGLALGTRERIVLIQAGEEQLLLGVTPQQINLLHKLETSLPADKDQGLDFGGKLRQILQQREGN